MHAQGLTFGVFFSSINFCQLWTQHITTEMCRENAVQKKEPALDSSNRKSLYSQGHREHRPLSCSSGDDLSALVMGHLSLPERGGGAGKWVSAVSLRGARAFT